MKIISSSGYQMQSQNCRNQSINFEAAKGSPKAIKLAIEKGAKLIHVPDRFPEMEKFKGLYVTENDLAAKDKFLPNCSLDELLDWFNENAKKLTVKLVNKTGSEELAKFVESFPQFEKLTVSVITPI